MSFRDGRFFFTGRGRARPKLYRAGRATHCVYQLIKIICYSRGNLNLDCVKSRVAEVVRKREGCSPKSLDSKKVSSTIIHYFVAILRFVAIYALFGRLWSKKFSFFGQKQCFLSMKGTITWYILQIICQICKFATTRKNDAFVAKIANKLLMNICMAIFALAERLSSSATLVKSKVSHNTQHR